MPDDEEWGETWEIEVDPKLVAERRFRERQYTAAGIGEFTAFRLAMRPSHELDWHRVVERKQRQGLTDDQLTDLYLD